MNLAGFFVRRTRRVLLASVLLVFWAGVALFAQEQVAKTQTEADRLWADGAEQIVSGHFARARDLLSEIIKQEPANKNYLEVAAWLNDYRQLDAIRTELQVEQREQYLKKARKKMQEQEWAEALGWTRLAMEGSNQPAEFMREPWFQELHDKAVELAEQHREEGEWAKASGIYYELKILFEGNKEYEERLEECISHSRIDAMYRPESDQIKHWRHSNWKTKLSGITAKMVDDALWRIHANYVTEADFKKITEAGLKRLILLSESESLAQLFPSMQEEDKRSEFKARLQRRLKRVAGLKDLSYREVNKDIFPTVLRINEETVALKKELIIYEFLEGALDTLDPSDQFTSMIWPADIAEFEKHTQGKFTGVGIQIGLEGGQLTVVTPLEDTPAFRAGIQAGDKITHVDGEPTKDITLNGAVKKITGPVQSKVVLTIYRPATGKTFDVELVRDIIEIQSVKGQKRSEDTHWDYLIDPDFGIAYVKINNFTKETASDLKKALRDIRKRNARAMILDLRFNPGGLLSSAIEVAELFLPDEKLIVKTEGQRGTHHTESYSNAARAHEQYGDLPLVVLVNEQSASASEIVSGALKDHGRAVIVGERTFGKGSVQNLIPIGNTRAFLKVTTAYYYLPNGGLIHRIEGEDFWGVQPDIEVKLVPREMYKAFTMRRDADVIRARKEAESLSAVDQQADTDLPAETVETNVEVPAGDQPEGDRVEEGPEEEPEEEDPSIELPDVDYQLETALLVLRVQLLRELGFDILPKVKLGAKDQPLKQTITMTN